MKFIKNGIGLLKIIIGINMSLLPISRNSDILSDYVNKGRLTLLIINI